MADRGRDSEYESDGSENSGFDEQNLREAERKRRNFDESDIEDMSDWEVSSVSSVSSADLDARFQDFSSDESDDEWTDQLAPINVREFTEAAGPKHDLPPGSHPINFFNLLFEDNFFQTVADETNLYATQMQQNRPDPRWEPTTCDEMRAFFSLQIIMGIHQLPEYSLYWADDKCLNVPGVSEVMTKARYEKLTQYFHLVDNTRQPANDSPDYDPLYKVRPLINMVNRNFLAHYTPGREVSIDEAMIGFKGRTMLKQYMPAKPTKWGIKVWQLSESSTGYTSQFQVYTGRREGNQDQRGLGHRVVMTLLQPILGKNYHVYFDNFFSSLPLFDDLARHRTYGCGTLRLNRRGLPLAIKNAKLRRPGETVKRQKGNLLVTVWKDKRQVAVISSNQQSTDSIHTPRRGPPVSKPDAITNYNQHMGGVDLADQHRAYYSVGREHKKWWKYIVNFCLDVALVNAHRIYIASNQPMPKSSRKFSHLTFRLQVADALRGGFTSRKRPAGTKANSKAVRPVLREENIGHHVLVHIDGRKKVCVKCSADGVRTPAGGKPETNYKCQQCNVALCRTRGCFVRYHQELML